MAFNLLDLFGPGAVNRLLQPPGTAQGVPNMLMTQPVPAAPPLSNALNFPVAGNAQPAPGPQIDPQTTAAIRSPAPQPVAGVQVAQNASKPGFLDRYKDFANSDQGQYMRDVFAGWAMGRTPQESLAFGGLNASQNSRSRQNTNQTVDWLKSHGMDEQTAKMTASSPPALADYLKNLYAGQDPKSQLELKKLGIEVGNLEHPQQYTQLTSEEVKASGLDPSKAYQRGPDNKVYQIGGDGVTVNTGDYKVPTGYQPADPNDPSKGVVPIPGGPATQLPAEVAGRIGLTDNFLKQLPDIRKSVESGGVTGPWDRAQAGNNSSSPQAQTYRQIQSGVDALTRMLTGAGQNLQEATAYASRYLPTYTDDATSATHKLDQLQQELESAKETALRGRGGGVQTKTPQQNDPLGIR